MIAAAFCMVGCISNDLPYPVVVPHITAVEADGAEDVQIDYDNQIVTIYLQEYVNPREVNITSVKIDQEIAVSTVTLTGKHDLSVPLKFTLKTYDEYDWMIKAAKNIDRYFTVQGQVGSSVIDAINCRAVAYVSEGTDLTDITVTSLKLGPEGLSDYSLSLSQMKDFTDGIPVDVTAFGLTETWRLYVEITDSSVDIKNINPWTREAYIISEGVAGKENGFEYRALGSDQWIRVPESDITADGGTFTAHITGLQPDTPYEAVAFCGSDRSSVKEFFTDSATQLPNHSFEDVSLVTGKDYYKWYNPDAIDPSSRTMFWGTGDGEGPDGVNGSASMGIVLTTPDTDDVPDGKICVKCASKSFAGMLTSGNIFTGQFVSLVGTSGGMLNYGRPWTTRPKALKFKMKYESGPIDIIGTVPPGETVNKGDNDRCNIIVSVGEWDYRKCGGSPDSPVHVNTVEKVFFSKDTEGTIGYGDYVLAKSTDGWIEVEIPIEYYSLTKKPTHIIITCATSMRGDYFTGSSKSTLWVDDFDLIY